MKYNITEAKANIDLILDSAESGIPQFIKRRDKEVAVVVSIEDWNNLCDQKVENDIVASEVSQI